MDDEYRTVPEAAWVVGEFCKPWPREQWTPRVLPCLYEVADD